MVLVFKLCTVALPYSHLPLSHISPIVTGDGSPDQNHIKKPLYSHNLVIVTITEIFIPGIIEKCLYSHRWHVTNTDTACPLCVLAYPDFNKMLYSLRIFSSPNCIKYIHVSMHLSQIVTSLCEQHSCTTREADAPCT